MIVLFILFDDIKDRAKKKDKRYLVVWYLKINLKKNMKDRIYNNRIVVDKQLIN